MFWKRLVSGIILVLAALALMLLGDIWLLAAVGVLSLTGVFELLRVFGLHKHPFSAVVYIGTVLFDVLLFSKINQGAWAWTVIILVFIVMLAVYVIRYPKDTVDDVAKCLFAFLYVPVLLSFIYRVRCMENGEWLVWLVMIGSWGSDTCAYVTGMLMGKHHFSELSPKKTIEGCIGGILGASLIGFLFALFFPKENRMIFDPKICFPVVCAVCALISQLGDLAASAVKRNYDIKDYGNLIPGHGGVMDRFDSVLFAAPFVYYLLVLFTAWGSLGL